MKLVIPRPISEVDISNVDVIVQARNPNYTNGKYVEGAYETTAYPLNDELKTLILDDCKSEGMITRCIVVHKKVQLMKRMDPNTWGIIIAHNAVHSAHSLWRPVRVRWFSGSYEDCHGKDLIVMIYAPDLSILQGRARSDISPNPL